MHGVAYERVDQPQHAAEERDATKLGCLGVAREGVNQGTDDSNDEWPDCDQHDQRLAQLADLKQPTEVL